MTDITYQVGGSLATNAPSYVIRQADEQLYQALIAGEFCYVLNSRQMGKSSLLVRTFHRLRKLGYQCATLDLTQTGSENITPNQWYKGVVGELWRSFNLLGKVNLKSWWRDEENVSLLQRLSHFIEDILLVKFAADRIFIFIDEVDSILGLDFPVDDFFALIRFCYNQRAINPEYNRLTFAIFGVATPSDLIADKNRTPFNIGVAIDLAGFTFEETQPLIAGLSNKFRNSDLVVKEILNWTCGQPFMTQKLCYLAAKVSQKTAGGKLNIPPGTEAFWVENIVRSHIIHNWESQDEPEHLRTIRDRILRNSQRAGRLLGIYQQILQSDPPLTPPDQGGASEPPLLRGAGGISTELPLLRRAGGISTEPPLIRGAGGISTDDSREQIELLLSGLVLKDRGYLQVKNRIYAEVFNLKWVDKQLGELRPYSQTIEAWIASNQTDESRLLRGKALKDASSWAQLKSLSDVDYQFLAASEELDRREVQQALEAERTKEVEARLEQEKRATRLQQMLLGAVITALQQSQLSEIEAIATSSEALFATEQKLDALIAAIKAKRKLQQLGGANRELENRVQLLLEKAVYGASEFNRLSGHEGTLFSLAISPDSETIASSGLDNTVKLWRRDGTLLTTLPDKVQVSKIAFSPDGQILACASNDRTVKLWHSQDNSWHHPKLLHVLAGDTNEVAGLAFSPDGETLAASGQNNTLKLWNKNGTLLTTLDNITQVRAVAFSPDGEMVVTGSTSGTMRWWKKDGALWNQAKLLHTFLGHTALIRDMDFSPDGEIFASVSFDGTVKLWSAHTPANQAAQPLQILEGHKSGVNAISFSPDGQIIVTSGTDSIIKFWSRDGKELESFSGNDGIWDMQFSRDGTFIASVGLNNTVKLWQPKNLFFSVLRGHNAPVYSAAFSSEGKLVATASLDGTAKLWQRDGTLLNTLEQGSSGIWVLAFSPDGQTIATAGEQTVQLWHKDGKFLGSFQAHEAVVYALAWSPDGQILATASLDGTAKLWQPEEAIAGVPPRRTLKLDGSGFWGIAFSPDGHTLATGSGSGVVAIWKPDGTLWQAIAAHKASIFGVSFSPDGKMLVSASMDGTAKLWQVNLSATPDPSVPQQVQPLQTFRSHTQGLFGVSFSPDGEIIATASFDSTVKIWHKEGILLRTLTGHKGGILRVAFSPDGSQLISTSFDHTAIVWNLQRILNTDPLTFGCNFVRDYLRTNADVKEEDRHLCDGIGNNIAKE